MCPVCTAKDEQVVLFELKALEIKEKLWQHFDSADTRLDFDFLDYKLVKCGACELEYSKPMLPGSDDFYSWIVEQESYYPGFRWEYEKVKALIIGQSRAKTELLLDVGCGDGVFLEYMRANTKLEVHGLDTTLSSVQACNAKGLNVRQAFLEDYAPERLYDYIVSFHVLEHVPNPKLFLTAKLNLLKKGGEVFVSTPLSPMSFEYDWMDILNYPPHHMTRWTIKAYQALANELDCSVTYYFPPSSIWKNIYVSLLLATYGKKIPGAKMVKIFTLLAKPLAGFKSYQFQKARYRLNSSHANTVLVKFKRHS